MPSEAELVLRLVVASLLGGAIGLERELRDQPAGFRTHILVALGACLFAVISAYGFDAFFGRLGDEIRFDPSRLAAQIVTGIGFLGAGAIIRYGATVRGLTTAASLWVVAAVGLAVALGAYLLAGVTSAITLASLWGLRRVRGTLFRGLKPGHEEFLVETDEEMELQELVGTIAGTGAGIEHLRIESEDGTRQLVLYLRLPPGVIPGEVVGLISKIAGVRNVDWTR